MVYRLSEDGYANAKAILEAEYGQITEIVNAYVKNIMELPIINGTSPTKVKKFYKELRFNVQSLETLGRLADVKGNVRSTLDKDGKNGIIKISSRRLKDGRK